MELTETEQFQHGIKEIDDTYHKMVYRYITHPPSNIEEFIDTVRETAKELKEPQIDIAGVSDYGDYGVEIVVSGYELADMESIREMMESRDRIRLANDQQMLKALKGRSPELFEGNQ